MKAYIKIDGLNGKNLMTNGNNYNESLKDYNRVKNGEKPFWFSLPCKGLVNLSLYKKGKLVESCQVDLTNLYNQERRG